MSAVTVRNLPEETHRALRRRAAQHGRCTEAEIRNILENAVRPKLGLSSALAGTGRSTGGVNLKTVRDEASVEAAVFK